MSQNGSDSYRSRTIQYGTFGTDKYFTKINHELYRSVSYICLTPIQRLILHDMIGRYMAHSAFDSEHAKLRKPFEYSFGDCRERVKRTAFYASIKAIIKNGFFEYDTTRRATCGEAQRFNASTNWRVYQPGQMELDEINAYADRRAESRNGNSADPNDYVNHLIAMNRTRKEQKLYDQRAESTAQILARMAAEQETNYEGENHVTQ